MRRELTIAGILLLLGMMALGLSGCQESLATRPPAQTPGPITQQTGVPPSTGAPTPRPGETVVTVFTPIPPGPGNVTPTQDLSYQTPVVSTPVATAAPVATTAPGGSTGTTGQPIVHVVQTGDTLSSIAYRYGTTVQAIAVANNIANQDVIQPGQRLTIPVRSSAGQPAPVGCRVQHTVKSGEWIWQIARNYGADPYRILAANGLTIATGQNIVPGQVLCIP